MKKRHLNILIMSILFALMTTSETSGQTEQITPENAKTMNSTKSTVTFMSKDGIQITGDVYMTDDRDNPFIMLFHQARYSRGEYLEIAPKLNELGFNCMAIDQRSGNEVKGVINTTHLEADAKHLPTEYPDAVPDLEAAIEYVQKNYKPKKLIFWGSSYSSSLVFILAHTYKGEVDALISFAPGEYFTYHGKKVEDYSKGIEIPVFVTSAKNETDGWQGIFANISSDKKVGFIPTVEGIHGAKVLWSEQEDNAEYWEALITFLESIK